MPPPNLYTNVKIWSIACSDTISAAENSPIITSVCASSVVEGNSSFICEDSYPAEPVQDIEQQARAAEYGAQECVAWAFETMYLQMQYYQRLLENKSADK